MSLLTLLQLNLFGSAPLVVKPEHAFAAAGRETAFTSTATRSRIFTAPARTRDFIAGSYP